MASFPLPISRFAAGARLDAELARGLDPQGVPERATRARWITSPARRDRLAASYERLVADAARPRRGFSAAIPIRRAEVLDARGELLAVADALRATPAPAPNAVACARALLSDMASPVYTDTGEDLREIARQVRSALEA